MEIVRDCENLDIGGKAANLCRLKQSFPVPDFFVVQLETQDELGDVANQERIREECERRRFSVLAVRSSASCEDADEATFAGMFETRLGVSPDGVVDAVRAVLQSVSRSRVLEYRRTARLPASDVRMHVIIQRFVTARVSGVCITRMPDEQTMVIEACFGLGEALVGSRIAPDRYLLDRRLLEITGQVISYQPEELALDTQTQTVKSRPLEFHRRTARKLAPQEATTIARSALRIEADLGLDTADVEWAYEGDVLNILQARAAGARQ